VSYFSSRPSHLICRNNLASIKKAIIFAVTLQNPPNNQHNDSSLARNKYVNLVDKISNLFNSKDMERSKNGPVPFFTMNKWNVPKRAYINFIIIKYAIRGRSNERYK
jgi:hypothetical protein